MFKMALMRIYAHSEANSVLIALNIGRRSATIDIPIPSFQHSAEDMLNRNRVVVSERFCKGLACSAEWGVYRLRPW